MARRMFRGYLSGNWRFRISKPGYDAKTEADDSANIAFDSDDVDTLPIFYRTSVYTPGSATNQFNVMFPSALPFIPLCTFLIDHNNWPRNDTRSGQDNFNRFYFATRDYPLFAVVAYHVLTDRVRCDALTVPPTGVTINFPLNWYLGELYVFAVPSGA